MRRPTRFTTVLLVPVDGVIVVAVDAGGGYPA